MTIKEKIVLWIAVAIIVIITIYPPVHDTVSYQGSSGVLNTYQVVHYKLLFTESVKRINHSRLLLQYLVVSIIMGGIMATLIFTRRQIEQRREQQIAALAAARKNLLIESAKLNLANKKWEEYRNQLEKHLKQQSCEFEAAKEKLQKQIAERKQDEELITERTAELSASNEELQRQITEHTEFEERLNVQVAELAATKGELQHEIDKDNLPEEQNENAAQDEEAMDGIKPFDPQKIRDLAELAKRLT